MQAKNDPNSIEVQVKWCEKCLAYTFHVVSIAGGWDCLNCRIKDKFDEHTGLIIMSNERSKWN